VRQRFFCIALVMLLFPSFIVAQDFPRVEVFGGYSFFRMPSEFSDNNAYAYTTEPARLNGWNINAVGNLNRWVGVEADFGGYYGEAAATYIHAPVPVDFVQDFDVHSYLFGPRLSLRRNRVITPFIHILFGGVSVSRMPVSNSPQSSVGIALGGGLDFRVARHFAVRAVQADYIKSSFTYYNEDNFRLSFGGVVRF
jgi:hypothetical protein